MRKRFLTLLMLGGLALTTNYYLASCSGGDDATEIVDPKPDPEPDPDPKPDPKPDPTPDPGTDVDGEFPTDSEIAKINKRIPLNLKLNSVEGDNMSVGIKVTKVEEGNIIFRCTPGESVASYYIDVMPISVLYNTLLNVYMESHPGTDLISGWDPVDVEDVLFDFLSNAGGGFNISPQPGNEDEYFDHEYDWINSQYAQQYPILPGCKYVITALSCSDEEGTNCMNLSLCYVETPQQDLIGNPRVELEYTASYKSFKVSVFPNPDCVYFTHFGTNQDQVDQFEDNLGSQMLSEWLRHIYGKGGPLVADQAMADLDGDGLPDNSYSFNFGENADPELYVTALGLGMDVNCTANTVIDRVDFHLKPMPEEIEAADAEVKIQKDRVGSDIFYFDIEMTRTCPTVFYSIYKKEEALAIMASDAMKKAEVDKLKEGGWGRGNKNYVWDNANEQVSPSSKGFTYKNDFAIDVTPGSEYVVLYVPMNHFYQYKELKMSEVVTTKPISYDFDKNESNLAMELTDVSRTGCTVNLTYDPAKTGIVYLQYFTPEAQADPRNEIPATDSSDEVWVKWLLYNQIANANRWVCEPSGKDNYGLVGINAGQWIYFVATASDMNGVMAKPVICKAQTRESIPGPNPEINMSYTLDGDNFKVNYTIVKDVEYFRVGLGDCNDDLYNNYFNLRQLINGNPIGTYKEYQKAWKKAAIELSMDVNDDTTREHDFSKSNGPVIAWGYAIGAENGEPVQSEPQYLIAYKKNDKIEVKTLEDYFPGTKALKAKSTVVYRPKSVMRNLPVRRDGVIPMVKNVTRDNLPFGYKLLDMRRVGTIK